VLLILLAALRGLDWLLPVGTPSHLEPGEYAVRRNVDGDTLLLANGARVRLIGADTPETVRPNHPVEPFGPEASQFTREMLAAAGNRVRLEFDGPAKDRYGRFLAVVWVDGRMLNEELLRRGLARLRTEFRFSPPLKARLRAARDEAKDAARGIHGPLPVPEG
jgi:micrococcal nuclease